MKAQEPASPISTSRDLSSGVCNLFKWRNSHLIAAASVTSQGKQLLCEFQASKQEIIQKYSLGKELHFLEDHCKCARRVQTLENMMEESSLGVHKVKCCSMKEKCSDQNDLSWLISIVHIYSF